MSYDARFYPLVIPASNLLQTCYSYRDRKLQSCRSTTSEFIDSELSDTVREETFPPGLGFQCPNCGRKTKPFLPYEGVYL